MVFFSGLLYGKMGISLFFFHYSRYAGNSLYDEYAHYLVDIVKSQIHEDYPLDYERGLAGVGTGFNYLKKHGYFDVGDDYMSNIDSKIIKAVYHERRVGLLTGFGRYLLSRYESNPSMKDSLIQLVDLLINHSESTQNNETLSLLCDLYLLDIEKEKIDSYLSDSMDALIKDVQKEPVSEKLFSLIKFSHIPSCSLWRPAACEALDTVFTKKRTQLTGIDNLQWLLQCEYLLKNDIFQPFISKVKRRIIKNIDSFQISKLDEIFSDHQDFAFHGGYAGLGLALLSVSNPEHNKWITML